MPTCGRHRRSLLSFQLSFWFTCPLMLRLLVEKFLSVRICQSLLTLCRLWLCKVGVGDDKGWLSATAVAKVRVLQGWSCRWLLELLLILGALVVAVWPRMVFDKSRQALFLASNLADNRRFHAVSQVVRVIQVRPLIRPAFELELHLNPVVELLRRHLLKRVILRPLRAALLLL